MTDSFYGEPEEFINNTPIMGYEDDSGLIRFMTKGLASNNFDGWISSGPASVSVSNVSAGQSLAVYSGSSIQFYPILSVSKQDPFLDSGSFTGEVIISYIDSQETKSITYASSATQVVILKEDWTDKYLGESGWYISQEGNAIFANVAVRGRIEATSGYIGGTEFGWEIDENLIKNASVGFYAPEVTTGEIAIFAGARFQDRASAAFRVGYDGTVNASSATIRGNLTATTLDVGGANGIVYNGSAVTIGASVNILAPVTVNSLQVGASPTLLKIANDVNGTNDGIYINANNYWYSDGQFGVGGSANNVVWSGSTLAVTGDINATTITASNGTIAGFTLSNNQFSIPGITFSSSGGLRLGNPVTFSVDQNGNMVATSASISGDITANSGRFTGSISAQYITASVGEIAGFTLARSQLSTASVVVSSSGGFRLGNPVVFSVDQFGNLRATSASITGNITATSGQFTGSVGAQHITASTGTIAGWGLSASILSGTNASIVSTGDIILGTGQNVVELSSSDTNFRLWAGSALPTNAPFRVTSTGGLVATSASITGDITAQSGRFTGSVVAQHITASTGNVGGWTLGASALTGNSASLDAAGSIRLGSNQNIVALSSTDSNRIWAGSANSATAPFRVTSTGGLVATSASITGNIVATSGSFSGDITASAGRFVGAVSVSSSGAIYAGNNFDSGQRTVLNASGLFGFHSNGLEAFALPVSGSPRLGTFRIIPTGIVSQSASNANMIYGDVDSSGNVTDGIVIRGFRSLGASAAIYNVQNGVATEFLGGGNGFYIDENARFKLKGATGSLSFDGNDLSIDGNINARSGRFTGSIVAQHITASTGSVGGWGLSASTLSGNNATLNSASGSLILGTGQNIVAMSSTDTNRIWAGSANSATAPFRVSNTGALTATGATINGDISATNIAASVGNIGGFLLSASSLTASNSTTTAVGITTGASAIFAGATSRTGGGARFWVSNNGILNASAAIIDGDSSINGTNIGRGPGNNSTNLRVGEEAFANNTTGSFNIALGPGALSQNTSGSINIGMGLSALHVNETGGSNVAIGSSALYSIGTNNNIAIGYRSMANASAGLENIAIGIDSLYSSKDSRYNVAIGTNALRSASVATYNVAIGYDALSSNKDGDANIAIGVDALKESTSGTSNIGLGTNALNLNTTGNHNIALGTNSMYFNSSGTHNVAIGTAAVFNQSSGSNNIGLGHFSLHIGNRFNNVALGASALYTSGGNFNIGIGTIAGRSITTGSGNVYINYAGTANTNDSFYIGVGRASRLAMEIDSNLNATLYGNLTVDTNTLFVDATNNQVGIGTVSPASALHVVGNALITTNLNVDSGTFYVDATNNAVNVGTTSHLGAKMSVLNNVSGSVGLLIRAATSQSAPVFTIQDSSGATKVNITAAGTAYFDGNFGIGVGNPNTKLDVDGSALIRSNASVTGNLLVDTNTLFVDATNNEVGVLTTTPASALHVAGGLLVNNNASVGGTIFGNLSGNASTASSINASLITGTTLPAAIVNSSLTSVGTLGSLTVSQATGRVVLQTDAGGNVNIGRIDNVASTPFIDFNSGATSVDYDVRIQVSGGNGTPGNGLLSITASQVNIDGGTFFADGANNRVGVGTTNPNQTLSVVGTASITGDATFGANITLGTSSAVTEVRSRPIFDTLSTAAATVHVATNTNNYRLQRSTASSRRWKNSIEDMPSAIQQIMNLRPVTFKFNEGYIKETDSRYNLTVPGLIAEEVAEAIPIAAENDENGPSDWNIRMLFPMLVKAVQEQQKEIIELRSIINNINKEGHEND